MRRNGHTVTPFATVYIRCACDRGGLPPWCVSVPRQWDRECGKGSLGGVFSFFPRLGVGSTLCLAHCMYIRTCSTNTVDNKIINAK
jgi:hypothetical protein